MSKASAQRNMIVGDIVLMQDSNQIRGQWKLGRVSKIYPGKDGNVRKVEVQYKNPRPGEPVTKYDGRRYGTVERAVHRLIVLLPEKRTIETNQTDRFLTLIINSKSVIFF